MASSFAGSQRLDERRRRRLAQETGEGTGDKANGRPSRRRLDASEVRPSRRQVLLPLQSLVPASLWKTIGLILLAILPGVAGLAFAHRLETIPEAFGRGIERLRAGSPTPIWTWYECLLLLTAAQMALVIRWVRSRSNHDYSGRYRIWTGAFLGCVGFATARATGLHLAIAESIAPALPAPYGSRVSVLWLGPAVFAGAMLLWRLQREMRSCPGSWPSLVVAGLAWLVSGLGTLGLLGTSGETLAQVSDRAMLAGHACLLLGMLLHARHVVHFTAEAPPIPQRTFRFPRPHFRFLSRKPAAEAPQESNEASSTGRRSPSRKRKRKPARKTSRSAPVEEEAEVEADSPAEDDVSSETEAAGDPWSDESEPESEDDPLAEDTADPEEEESWSERPVGTASPPRPHFSMPVQRPAPASTAEEDGGAESDGDDGDDDARAFEESPEFQGLSRKQRRKMLKQMKQRGR